MRAYGRRHRRWSRRHPQPLLLIPDEPLLIVGLAAIGRALFRYRSGLAPFSAGLTLAVAGLLLHHTHPDAWPVVAGVTAIVAMVAGLRGMPWGVARAEERCTPRRRPPSLVAGSPPQQRSDPDGRLCLRSCSCPWSRWASPGGRIGAAEPVSESTA